MPKVVPQVDDNMLRQVEELAGYGLSVAQIGCIVGFSERTVHERAKENEDFGAALQRGRAKAAAIVGKALFQRAKDGDVQAIRWWEMTREGRSEKRQVEQQAKEEIIIRWPDEEGGEG